MTEILVPVSKEEADLVRFQTKNGKIDMPKKKKEPKAPDRKSVV